MRTATLRAAAPGGRDEALPAREERLPGESGRRLPHVCFVAPFAWPVFSRDPSIDVVGGAEVQQAILARLFQSNGYRVSLICLDYGQPQRAVVDGVTVHKVHRPEEGVPVLRFLHPRLSSMWRALRAVDADIYYYRSASMWVAVMAAYCRWRGRRSIYAGASDQDFHADQRAQIRYARDRWLYRRGVAGVDAIVAQNATQIASCRAAYGREPVFIPSCYQPPPGARPASAAAADVLWVGAITQNKRPEVLLELAARLPHRRFVMVGGVRPGGQAFYERTRAKAAALPNVDFTGFLPLAQVEARFDRARLLVNTSRYEGMPNVFLQAWARGMPTLATVDVGVPAHCVASGVDGLAAEVESLFTDAARWKRASEAVRAYFEHSHSSAEVLGRYTQLFDALLA
jgi:glycosyltransferase involved in cell wall biosynthesis